MSYPYVIREGWLRTRGSSVAHYVFDGSGGSRISLCGRVDKWSDVAMPVAIPTCKACWYCMVQRGRNFAAELRGATAAARPQIDPAVSLVGSAMRTARSLGPTNDELLKRRTVTLEFDHARQTPGRNGVPQVEATFRRKKTTR